MKFKPLFGSSGLRSCVCASGSRSSSAARRLLSNGYNVLNLSGGMSRWQRAGLPVKKGTGK